MRSIGFGHNYNVESLRDMSGVFGAGGGVLEAVDEAELVQEFEAGPYTSPLFGSPEAFFVECVG